MNKLTYKLQQFMMGRNGTDALSKASMALAMVFYVLSILTRSNLLYLITILGMGYVFFRIFSKNISKRYTENQGYLRMVSGVRNRWIQRKQYKFFRCRQCHKTIRVPRKKGKIEVTCPICGKKKITRT